jgi:hypothetical protein
MSRKTLLFLSTDSFQAYALDRGVLTQAQNFSDDARGREQFSEFLKTRQARAYLLTDMIEEDFRQETVPHLTGSSQHALIQRKFEQYYRNTTFRMARLQQRQPDGRRDDEMLFSALTNPGRISAWVEPLLQNHTPLVGIYSLPHICTPLIRDIDSNHLLLLSWEKNAGLRQTYFLNKRLRFSRLTPLNPDSSFSEAIATEAARTQQYLHSLSLTPPGEMLSVHIICHADDKSVLQTQLHNNGTMQYAYLDIQALGRQIKSKEVYADSDATPLFLHLLASKPPRSQYANATHTHYFQLWQIRHILFGLAALAALVCLAWSALLLDETSTIEAENAPISAQVSRMSHETQQILQSFPNTSVPAADMKSAVTLLRQLSNYSAPAQEVLSGLGSALDNFPRIRTGKLSWKTSAAPASGSTSNLPAQIITFNGELSDFGNDYRGELNYLDNFQQALTLNGYTVSLSKAPLDFSSKGTINADVSDTQDKPAEFSLQLVWSPKQ